VPGAKASTGLPRVDARHGKRRNSFRQFDMVAQYILGACKTSVEVGIRGGRQMEQSQLGGWNREGRNIMSLHTNDLSRIAHTIVDVTLGFQTRAVMLKTNRDHNMIFGLTICSKQT